jgi:hypothetical protein
MWEKKSRRDAQQNRTELNSESTGQTLFLTDNLAPLNCPN